MKHIINKIRNHGILNSVKIFSHKITSSISNIEKRYIDMKYDSRTNISKYNFKSRINIRYFEDFKIDKKVYEYLFDEYSNHRFNVLGTGWKNFSIFSDNIHFDSEGLFLKQFLCESHETFSKKIWKEIVKSDFEYKPINWQLDIKSNYSWNLKKWYKDQYLEFDKKIDAKIPHEVSRMQHLISFAIYAMNVDEKLKKKILIEGKNQILDFIMMNPVRVGINWHHSMEVGIRVSNLLVSYDFFKQIDDFGIFDTFFERIFTDYIYEMGRHIINNLEYNNKFTTNHYIANITGLIFVSVYLDIDDWLSFSIIELVRETRKQFMDDGVNYEKSSFYHCLSLEMIIYSIAMILNLDIKKINRLEKNKKLRKYLIISENKVFFYDNFIETIQKAVNAVKILLKDNGELTQIGDNDSGKFIKFSHKGMFITNLEAKKKYINLKKYFCDNSREPNDLYWDENEMNKEYILNLGYALFNDNRNELNALESRFIFSLCKNFLRRTNNKPFKLKIKEGELEKDLKFFDSTVFKFNKNIDLLKNINFFPFNDAGWYLLKSDSLYLLVLSGENGQNGIGGHSHNDKLSFELLINGSEIFLDPGSYVYTSSLKCRNKFRSINTHNTIIFNEEEQNSFKNSEDYFFKLNNETESFCTFFEDNTIRFVCKYRKYCHFREFKIKRNEILITERANFPFKKNFKNYYLYSNGYGKLMKFKSARDIK